MQYLLSNDRIICSCKDFKQAKKLCLIWKQLPIIVRIKDEGIPDFFLSFSAIAKSTSSSSLSIRPIKIISKNIYNPTFKVRDNFLDSLIETKAKNDSLEPVDGIYFEIYVISLHLFLKEAKCINIVNFCVS